jgi:hypothetical protein
VPSGNDEFVMVRRRELIVTDRGISKDADVLSVTLAVKLEEPVTVGVPVTVPPTRARPGGNAPVATDHVYGGDPPFALSG